MLMALRADLVLSFAGQTSTHIATAGAIFRSNLKGEFIAGNSLILHLWI